MLPPPVANPTTIFCPHCQYNLQGLTHEVCPECGHAFDADELRRTAQIGKHPDREFALRFFLPPPLVAVYLVAAMAAIIFVNARVTWPMLGAVCLPPIVALFWNAFRLARKDEAAARTRALEHNKSWQHAIVTAAVMFLVLISQLVLIVICTIVFGLVTVWALEFLLT